MLLAGKTVIVTGSTTGIGKAIAEASVRDGATVVVTGRNEDHGKRLSDSLGDQAVFHRDDLSDPAAPQRIVDRAISEFGGIDALVNNAALVMRSDIEQTTAPIFDKVMSVNVRAPLLLIKAALPHLEKRQGAIANMGSLNSLGGESSLLPYSVSKGALLTLSKNLADAIGPQGVRLYHFNVGWVLTENEYQYKLEDGFPEGWPNQLQPREIPSGKMTTPEQVANIITFWISDRSRPFSGTVMELAQYPFAGRNPKRGD